MNVPPVIIPTRDGPLTRALGVVALIGIAFITVTCLLVQFLRTDLDWITTSMSIYVTGPYGAWVQASFYAPVPGIAALGIGWYRALDRRARSVFPMVLFVIGAIALCILASFTADATRWPTTLHGTIHQWAASATFLCITTAALRSRCASASMRAHARSSSKPPRLHPSASSISGYTRCRRFRAGRAKRPRSRWF